MRIECVKGWNGGLPQRFYAQFENGLEQRESTKPSWDIEINRLGKLLLSARNAKGESEAYVMNELPSRAVAKSTGNYSCYLRA